MSNGTAARIPDGVKACTDPEEGSVVEGRERQQFAIGQLPGPP